MVDQTTLWQQVEATKLKSAETKQIPADLDYTAVNGLRSEARQKLQAIRPVNLGHAARISGVSPSDISVLMVWLRNAGERVQPTSPTPNCVAIDPR